jgi:hypothetical protein
VERIYDSDHNDSSGEESTGTNIESQQQSNAQHKLLDPVEDSTVKHPPFSYSSQKVGSRYERRKSRRLSIRHRYSISNKGEGIKQFVIILESHVFFLMQNMILVFVTMV